MANGLNFYDLKKTLTPGVILTLPLGYIYIHAYYHSSQTKFIGRYIYISQVSGERLQDHWSSGFNQLAFATATNLALLWQNTTATAVKDVLQMNFLSLNFAMKKLDWWLRFMLICYEQKILFDFPTNGT